MLVPLMVTRIALSLALLLVSGCYVVSYDPKLDRELSSEAVELLKTRGITIHEAEPRLSYGDTDLPALAAYVGNGKRPIVITHSSGKRTGFQCFEPMLAGLTLGIVPINCDRTINVSLQAAHGAITEQYEIRSEESVIGGWVALFMAPLPGWEFGSGEESVERAIKTAVNAAARKWATQSAIRP